MACLFRDEFVKEAYFGCGQEFFHFIVRDRALIILPQWKSPKQSDIVGLPGRISQGRERQQQLFIILTDLADTRYKDLPPIPAPEGQVRVTRAPAPERSVASPSRNRSSSSNARASSGRRREAVPWVVEMPYFS